MPSTGNGGGPATRGPADPYGLAAAVSDLVAATRRHPDKMALAAGRYATRVAEASGTASARAFGIALPDMPQTPRRDRRFTDEAWQEVPFFYGLRRTYEALCDYLEEVLAIVADDLDPVTARKAAFVVRSALDAGAPTNFLLTNPAALRRATTTGGISLAHGLENFLWDLADNNGLPRSVDPNGFAVGNDLAVTPGQVVLRTDLIELIQYAPQTETVHEIPLLCSPPWINRYYVMDLAPGRSFIEWAVQHGHTVFCISYVNPDASMAGTTFDDYVNTAREAIAVIREITGAPRVNIAGFCLGGILTLVLLGLLAAEGDDSLGAATVLNTVADFTEPGVLGVFTDAESVEHLAREMEQQGYLDAATLANVFALLRPNDMIWNYVASGWLMGTDPPKFDILAWNSDPVRLPAAMYTAYLRACYVNNDLAHGRFQVDGTPIRLDAIHNDLYALAAEKDHITPWRSAYATTHLVGGDTVFVRSSSGHTAGIVNPPSPKSAYWTNTELPATPEEWLAGAEKHTGSWWEHWIGWLSERAGDQVPPPPMGSKAHPPLDAAPGTYVFT